MLIKNKNSLIINNVRSAYNVGSMLRTADGAGIKIVYICGYSPLPSDSKVAKTSLGAEQYVKWEYSKSVSKLIKKLKNEGVKIIALEQTLESKNILKYNAPQKSSWALVVGNEIKGVPENILKEVDYIVEIPMFGSKESLNVAVATGIALYALSKN